MSDGKVERRMVSLVADKPSASGMMTRTSSIGSNHNIAGAGAAGATAAANNGTRSQVSRRQLSVGGKDHHDGHQRSSDSLLRHHDDEHEWARTHGNCWQRLAASRFMLSLRNPTGFNRRVWNLLIVAFIMYNIVTIPLRVAFHQFWSDDEEHHNSNDAEGSPRGQIAFVVVDYVGDLFFVADIALLFYTPFSDEGFLVTDRSAVMQHYLRGWFLLDLLGTLPLDFFSFVVWKHALLRLPRILRIAKWDYYFRIWEQSANHGGFTHLVRFTKLVLGLFMVLHWWACAYIAIAYLKGFGGTHWLPEEEVEHLPMGSQYLFALFWSANYIMDVGGEPEKPTNDFERGITLFICMFAVFIVAIIIGNVAELIAQLSSSDEHFRKKMEELNLFMRNRRLPDDLKHRIRQYYRNIWSRMGGLDDKSILGELPVALRSEVNMVMNHDLIQKVPLFQQGSQGFIDSLIQHLEPQIYSPGDMIIKEGDVGNEMFFIRRGKVEVVLTRGEVVSTLEEGAYFGEIALLEENCKRTASIRASGFCDLFVLTKENLEAVLKGFPEQRGLMREIADVRRSKDLLRAALARDPLFEHSSEVFLKRVTDAFQVVEFYRVINDEEVTVDWLFDTNQSADAVFFLAKGAVDLLARTAAVAGKIENKDDDKDGSLPSSSSFSMADTSSVNDEQLIGSLAIDSFLGEIGNTNYSVSARVTGDVSSTIIFALTKDSLAKLHDDFPSERHSTAGFVRRFRTERDYRKSKFQEEKTIGNKGAAAIPLGFVSAAKLLAKGQGKHGGQQAQMFMNMSSHAALVSVSGQQPIALSSIPQPIGGTISSLPLPASSSSSSSSPSASSGEGMPPSFNRRASMDPMRVTAAAATSAATPSVITGTSSNSTVMMGPGGAGFTTPVVHFSSASLAGLPAVKSQWLNRLGALNTISSDKDIESMNNDELIIANECLSIIASKLTLQLFRRVEAA